MAASTWTLHPNTLIAHHAGRFLAARLSGSIPPMPINLADFVLLSRFATPATAEAAVTAFCSEDCLPFLPGRPSAKPVRLRIAELQRHGILLPADAPPPAPEDAPRPIADLCLDASVDSDLRFRLGRNFALQPQPGGFSIYSAASGQNHLLALESALLLMSFSNGRSVAQAAAAHRPALDAERFGRAAAWFAGEGLLVTHNEAAGATGDYRRQVRLRSARGPGWREIEPDGRIPVYFVPHMENHFPLALGMIYSALASWQQGALNERFQLIPISYLPPRDFLEGPYRKFGRGVWLFSNYMWSLDLNLQISTAVKQHDAGNLTIHGGPSTPSYEQACAEFMARHTSVDIAVHGEGELTSCEVLQAIERDAAGLIRPGSGMAGVNGLTFRDPRTINGALQRTAARQRMREPDFIPSPYTSGVFDAYEARVEAAIVETNRGCPFKCTFCDWGSATNQKISRFDMERIFAELEWIGSNEIGVLWIADANFGMLKRDLEVARRIIDIKRRYGFPREVVVNYTKNANELLAEIIKVFSDGGIISQGIISIQTSDEATLEIIDRQNIRTEKYDQLIDIFSELGLPLSTDLMIGLPGITPAAFDRDLQRYIDADVSVKAYPTQLLPNSPMAHPDYLERHRIEVDANGFLLSCSSYTAADLEAMHMAYHAYTVADGYGTLRHVLRYLQWEHGIRAMDFIHELTAAANASPERHPAIAWVIRLFSAEKCMPGGWQRFYDEVAAFVARRYGIERDGALDVVLRVNEAVMPDDARRYPWTVRLAHDYVRYFADHNRRQADCLRPLASYPPGELTVTDPNRMAVIDFEYQQYDTHQFFWELHAPVSRPKSIAEKTGAA